MKGSRKNKVFLSIEECPEEYSGTLPNRFINIKGEQYNNLKVLYLVGFKNKRSEWLCQCLNCGKYTIINSHNLRTGHSKSCGCLISEKLRTDLTGKTFNFLKVLRYDKSINENPYWIVECLNCGKIYSVCGDSLKRQISCGCISSIGEKTITSLLRENEIDFAPQYSFDDLIGKNGNKLRFDFAIFYDGKLSHLIEMQGIQHYFNVYNINEEEFKYRLSLDEKKRTYCKEHNIPLIEIKYDEEITLEKLLIYRSKTIGDEDFLQYKKPSMFISNTKCMGFKCDKENNTCLCINRGLSLEKNKIVTIHKLIKRYLSNPITSSVVFGGLENFDEFEQLLNFIKCFRKYSNDDIVIYTGYYEYEIMEKIKKIKQFPNIIIKFGRFVPNQQPHYDEVLGVNLVSDGQYARRIS